MTREAFKGRIEALIARLGTGERDDEARDALLEDLIAWQAERIAPFGRLRAQRPGAALPTDVFRYARIAAHSPEDDVRTFLTSGTTSGARGRHPFRDLSLYDAAACAWASAMLFRSAPRRIVALVPREEEAPESSLSYMVARFGEWFGPLTYAWNKGGIDLHVLREIAEPVALLGTSFAFVHAYEELKTPLALPEGSCVMQTGGFKGRSREVSPKAMLTMLQESFGVPPARVIAEYGMTELSSQAYETTLVAPGAPRRLRFPGWVRVSVVDPDTLAPTSGEGLLRIDDAANLDSVCALQTADRARKIGDEFLLLGRNPGAVPRGCSLAVEEALS
ncbi:MAG: acyl-protein synthetase [Myxococcota bacterium]